MFSDNESIVIYTRVPFIQSRATTVACIERTGAHYCFNTASHPLAHRSVMKVHRKKDAIQRFYNMNVL